MKKVKMLFCEIIAFISHTYTVKGVKRALVLFLEMSAGIVFVCAGAALGIIAALGQTTSTGTSYAIALALNIKVGNGLIILYCFFMLLQMLMLKRKFKPLFFIQIIPVVLHGWILNFFKYDFAPFLALDPQSYLERFAVYAVGVVLISIGFCGTKASGFANYPPDTFCALLAKRKNMQFGTAKLIVDFCYVGATLLICFVAGLDFGIVREGTVIFAAANGVLINLFLPHIEKLFTAVEKLCGVKKTLV
ncbi:MAG: hypothetical protein IKA10_03450 [Oscillospiraceae bacterium]|nr:hypothetical protein [Oscillospiraceae bacterium]